MYMRIISPAFTHNQNIPNKYTCDGEDVNPPLVFLDIPEDAQSLALVVEDPDAPGKVWVHWVVFNIDPHKRGIGEDSVSEDSIEGVTDFGHTGYSGPCPPEGPHRYFFKLYALSSMLDANEDITKQELDHLMEGYVIEKAELIGLYARE